MLTVYKVWHDRALVVIFEVEIVSVVRQHVGLGLVMCIMPYYRVVLHVLLLFMFSLVFVFLFMVRVLGGSILFLSFICFYFRFYLCLSVAEKNFFLEFCLGICSGQDLFLCRPICVAQYI